MTEPLMHRRHRLSRPEQRQRQSEAFAASISTAQPRISDFFGPALSQPLTDEPLFARLAQVGQMNRQLTKEIEQLRETQKRSADDHERLTQQLLEKRKDVKNAKARAGRARTKLEIVEDKLRQMVAAQDVGGVQQQVLDACAPDDVAKFNLKAGTIFPLFLQNAIQRINAKDPHGIRTLPELSPFCVFVYNLTGPRAYEILSRVLHLPSVDHVHRAKQRAAHVAEGLSDEALHLSIALFMEVR